MEQDFAGLLDAMLGKSAGRTQSCATEEVCGRVHELLQSPAWSRAWLAVLTTCRRPTTSWRGPGWLMGGFPWAHGRTIITTRAAEWVQQGEDSREVSATDLQQGVTGGSRRPACADDELERAGLGWLMGGFPWAHEPGDVYRDKIQRSVIYTSIYLSIYMVVYTLLSSSVCVYIKARGRNNEFLEVFPVNHSRR